VELSLATSEVLIARLAIISWETEARNNPVSAFISVLYAELTVFTADRLAVCGELATTDTLSFA
jgi:hypothetical protein